VKILIRSYLYNAHQEGHVLCSVHHVLFITRESTAMDYTEDTDTCQLRPASNVIYKLPNSVIDVCLVYGIDENTYRCLKPPNLTEKLQNDSSALEVGNVVIVCCGLL